MPREVITIQVGQCGNQIGCRFWDLVLREHAHVSNGVPVYDASLSTFFSNVDTRFADPSDIPIGDGLGEIRTLKARAILVDMEESVVNSLFTGPLSDLFDARQRLTDVSGSGNNWAHGHHVYGPQYRHSIEEQVRKAAERCDSLQCFFLMHSLGGGTGSGLGTYILEELKDLYPEVFRFVTCVSPSKDDDVVTSPYNTMLAMRCLIDSADCVLPVSNDALVNICNQISSHDASNAAQSSLVDLPQDERSRRPSVAAASAAAAKSVIAAAKSKPPGLPRGRPPQNQQDGSLQASDAEPRQKRSAHSAPPTKRRSSGEHEFEQPSQPERGGARVDLGSEKPYDRMNSLVAHLLNNLTSSMRFEGSLNLDLNEITMNLVPFPRMHFLLSSMSPLYVGKDPRMVSRGFSQTFSDVLTASNQLMNVDPRGSTYMALAFLARGTSSVSDVNRNVTRIRKQVKMLPYNEDAFKIGLCSVPPKGLPYSVLCLANSCATHQMLSQRLKDFSRLYNRKAHIHHYTEYMEKACFDVAFETANSLMKDYIQLDMLHETPASCVSPSSQAPANASSLLFAPSAWASHSAVNAQGTNSLQQFLPSPLI